MRSISALQAGAAMIDITPPLDVPIAGGFHVGYANKILEPLLAQAVYLSDGHEEVGMISLDICMLSHLQVETIREIVEKKAGIPKENILVAATHNHSGPVVTKLFLASGDVDETYVQVMIRKAADALILAKSKACPAKLGVGGGHEKSLVFNRRLMLPDGRVLMNFRAKKEDVQDAIPLGPIDPEVLVMRIDSEEGAPIAVIVNYALHNCTSGGGIHPDFAGYLGKYLRQILGEEVAVPFLAGACGNVNFIDYKDLEQPRGLEITKIIAKVLAGEVLKVHTRIKTKSEAEIAVASHTLQIPDRDFTAADEKLEVGMAVNKRDYHGEWAHIKSEGSRMAFPVEVQIIKIGNVAIAANPAEYFVEFGLEIKDGSPFDYTFISELTNGYAGYVPTRIAFEEGGYEPLRTVNTSHLSVDAGEIIRDKTLELLKSLR